MRHCTECEIDIEGDWVSCPLCGTALGGEASPSSFPDAPLVYRRTRVLRAVFLSSLALVLASFVAQFFFDPAGIGAFRSVWLGVASMWLVVSMAVRKRRNVAKGTVYLVVISGLVCVFWDYLTGWHSWSVTYAVPIACASSIIALLITVRVMRTDVGDHIVYSGLTVLLGFVPIVFLAFGWVLHPLPSLLCIGVSVITLSVLYAQSGARMRHELAKRLHL